MTTTRLTTRAAQIMLLSGMAPALAVDTAAAQVSAAPAAIRLAACLVARASRSMLRRMASGV